MVIAAYCAKGPAGPMRTPPPLIGVEVVRYPSCMIDGIAMTQKEFQQHH